MGSEAPKSIWRRIGVVSGLGAVAFVAPLLDIYGKNPEVFVANRTSTAEIVIFGVTVGLVLPLVAGVLLAIANLIGGRGPDIVYHGLLGTLSVAAGLVVSRQALADSTFLAVVLAIAVAAALLWLVRTIDTVFLFAALAIPLLLFMFLGTSASARLIWDEPELADESVAVGAPHHVVMLQLDEMPLATILDAQGQVNEKLFPSFARLAKSGTWYRNALSDSIATSQSVPAILTGQKGEQGLSPSYVDHPDNLFTLLDGAYEMHVIEWVAELCPEDVCPDFAGRAPARFSSLLADVGVVYAHLTFPGVLRNELPSIDNAWKGFLGQSDTPEGTGVTVEGLPVPPEGERQEWIDWVQRLIDGIDSRNRPTLSYAHLRTPHVPWVINPSGRHYERPEEYTEVDGVEGDGRWETDTEPALLGFQRHLYQVGFLDTMIGRLLQRLDQTGTWDDTMVIVVADHGASFVPGEHRRWPYEDNRDDLYRVPLFIKYPGQETGATEDLPAFGSDILPTIVDTLDVETEWSFDGQSLLELAAERAHDPVRWCCNGQGVSTDLDVLLDQASRNHDWIPDQGSWVGVAGASHGDLVGTAITDLQLSSDDEFRWSFDLGSGLGSVDRSSGHLQTLVTGRVAATSSNSRRVAFVVNDVVAGVGHVTRDSVDGGSFSGLLAEDLIADGSNDVEVLLDDGNGGWVVGSSDDLGFELIADDGRVIEVGGEGNRRVQVDDVSLADGAWTITGWGADVTAKNVPDRFYIFSGDELLAAGPPNRENRNVVAWFESEDLLMSGFSFEIPEQSIPAGVDRLLVVAEFGDGAVADPANLTP